MTVPDDAADNVIEREHPASDVEFGAVAVFATLAFETDTKGSALHPLWPMLLHFFSGFAPPTGTAAGTLDTSSIPQLIRALRSPLLRHQHRDHTACIVNTPGLISSFVRLLDSADHNVCEQTAWALGNIAGDSPIHRDLLLERGVLTQLAHIPGRLDDGGTPLTLRRNMTWTISNFCRGKPPPPLSTVASVLPYLIAMIQYPDSEVVADAMWSLSYISDVGTNDRIAAVLAHGALPGIVHHLSSDAGQRIETPALRCLGNIVRGDEHQTTLAIEHGAITVLCAMLRAQVRDPRAGTKKEILTALSDIAAGNEQQINALLQAGVFDLISDYIAIDDQSIHKEAQWTIANALQGASLADVHAIIGSPSFRALLNAASSHRIRLAGVEGIETALEHGFDAVAAIASPDELSAIVAALYEDKDLNVQQLARRIHAMIQGEPPGEVAEGTNDEQVGGVSKQVAR
jgi:hypothetical protein